MTCALHRGLAVLALLAFGLAVAAQSLATRRPPTPDSVHATEGGRRGS